MPEDSSSDDGTTHTTTMFANVCTGYGPAADVFELRRDLPKPVLSDREDDDRVLILTQTTTVNPADCKQRSGNLRLVAKHEFPLILGQDFCGTVAAVGKGVAAAIEVGDTVMGSTAPRNSCSAEYLSARANECVSVDPDRVAAATAAAAPTAYCTAWKGLFYPSYGNLPIRSERDPATTPTIEAAKPSVLIIGASGSVGSAAVQLAVNVASSVEKVVGVCGTSNLEYVQSLAAASTKVVAIDYRHPGYEVRLENERFDLILDCVGGDEYYRKFHRNLNFSNPQASYITCVGPVLHGGSEPITYRTLFSTVATLVPRLLGNYMLFGKWNSRYKIYLGFDTEPLEPLARWLEKGVLKPRIDPSSPIPLIDLAKAHETVETGHSSGKVVVEIRDDRD